MRIPDIVGRLAALLLLTTVCGSQAVAQTSAVAESVAIVPEGADTEAVSFATLVIGDSAIAATRYRRLLPVDLREPVFDNIQLRPVPRATGPGRPASPLDSAAYNPWISQGLFVDSLARALKQRYMIDHPLDVRYNERILPEPPKHYRATFDPSKLIIVMEEIKEAPLPTDKVQADAPRIDWFHKLDVGLQFSQAYISPNWYQGGNNALSMIGGGDYSVKLNQAFHPRLMFEANVSYKLALASTPDDSLRRYSVTEDIFQLNMKGGIQAFKHWFYSLTLNFKTQLLNSYPINSDNRAASFLSPGELNMGLGMTYDYKREKRFSINASISPLSWNLTTCIDPRVDEVNFGIEPGRTTLNRFGSSTEIKLFWAVTSDITLNSRLFAFTDFTDSQLDWENTIDFAINRFLSTKLYMHLRYDSTTPRYEDSRWHHWQFKEILSLGFAYKFSTL